MAKDLQPGTHIVYVDAVVVKDGKILLSQRSFEEAHEPGKWTIPGGKVDATAGDEWGVLEKTVAREVLEETGVVIEDSPKLLSNSTFIRSTGHHVIALHYLANWKSGEPKALEDTIAVRWIGPNEVLDVELAGGVKNYIAAGFKAMLG